MDDYEISELKRRLAGLLEERQMWRRTHMTLTDAEREAIAEAVGAYNDNDDDEECAKIAATLHGLLKRTEVRS